MSTNPPRMTDSQKAIRGILAIISLCLWYWLLHHMLELSNADPVMWVVFWAYVPTGILIKMLGEAI